jgi:type I restriction enzyme S subunit
MSRQAYPKYKPSNVEWLGKVPDGWEVIQLRYRLQDGSEGIKIGPFGSSLRAEFICENGYKVYGQENVIANDFVIGNRYIDEEKYAELFVYRLQPGDIVVTMMGTSGRCQVVPDGIDEGIMDSHLLRMRVRQEILDPKFIAIAIDKSNYIYDQLRTSGKGAIMHGLNSTLIKKLLIVLPSLCEQKNIIAFLDRETARIDALIEKKQRQIELLQEKRSALISHAVTKGLDPKAKMKDSGIEWLGQVPSHWRHRKLGYIASMSGGSTPSKANEDYWNGAIPWVSPKDMKKRDISDAEDHISDEAVRETSLRLLEPPVVLIVVRGMILAHTFPVALTSASVTINQDMKAIRPKPGLNADYLAFLLEGISGLILSHVEESAHGTKCLRTELWKKISVFMPDESEQISICAYLHDHNAKLGRMIDRIKDSVEKLREYRSALISAAVTGKIDVRKEVP